MRADHKDRPWKEKNHEVLASKVFFEFLDGKSVKSSKNTKNHEVVNKIFKLLHNMLGYVWFKPEQTP